VKDDRSARALEASGDLTRAAMAYLAVGAFDDAARVLAAQQRWADAARVLLSAVGGSPLQDADSRRRAYHAATFLAQAGDRHAAAQVLDALGDAPRAAVMRGGPTTGAPISVDGPPPSIGSRSGTITGVPPPPSSSVPPASAGATLAVMPGIDAAARAARKAGRPREAAEIFSRSGRTYEAGVCFYEAGDPDTALAHMLRVSPGSPRYRAACVYVIHIAAKRGNVPFEVDQYLADFAASDPVHPSEASALHALAVLYGRQGFEDEARDVLRRVVRANPADTAAAARLAALEKRDAGADMAKIAAQDLSFWAPARRSMPDEEEEEEEEKQGKKNDDDSADIPISIAQTSHTPPPRSVERPRIEIGGIVAERYRLDAEIGRGGMGIVFRARDLEIDEDVAIKLSGERIDDKALLQRFKLELTLCRSIGHTNVIRLFDIGAHGGFKFITMELLSGRVLRDFIGKLSLVHLLEGLRQIAEGLEAIHAKGIIHRDMKPANVFVTSESVLKIMDFGLAKKTDATDGITISGFMAGTPGYMPPEQLTDFGSVGPSADMYAFGALAYELATGGRPFAAKEPSQIVRLQFTTSPVSMREKNPDLPKDLDDLVLRLLDRDRNKRPTATDVKAELARLLAAT
jgi:hypothetical protein